MIIRLQKAQIKQFRNVAFGEIRFPCNLNKDIFAPQGDVLGIYGQNGSGKTTFIHVLAIAKKLLSGEPLPVDLKGFISQGQTEAEFTIEFSMMDDNGQKYKATYSTVLEQERLQETLKVSVMDGKGWGRLNPIILCDLTDREEIFHPLVKQKELFGASQSVTDELRVTKLLCAKERRSFIFSKEVQSLLKISLYGEIIKALGIFGRRDFFVVTNRYSGLISLDRALPVSFRTEHSLGRLNLPIDAPVLLPKRVYEICNNVVVAINTVLSQIIPGMELILQSMGEELLGDSSVGVRVQLIRVKGSEQLPLKYESEGIKKVIAILHLMIAAYNNPSITLAVDELDSGIYEYLLGELLRIMQNSGRGQLVFTSHNLYPLETLHTSSIVFTTTVPEDRYTRLSYVKSSNNLRLRYLREIMLGNDGDAELYQETDNAEIAHAFRKAALLEPSSKEEQ